MGKYSNLSINAGLFHCHAWLPEGPIRFVLVWLVLGDVWPSIAIKSLEVQYSHPTNKIQQISCVSIFNHNYCSFNTYHITHTYVYNIYIYNYIHSIFVLFCFAAHCLLLDPRETDRNQGPSPRGNCFKSQAFERYRWNCNHSLPEVHLEWRLFWIFGHSIHPRDLWCGRADHKPTFFRDDSYHQFFSWFWGGLINGFTMLYHTILYHSWSPGPKKQRRASSPGE